MISNEDNRVLAPLVTPSAPVLENEYFHNQHFQQHQIFYNQANNQNPSVNILESDLLSHKDQFKKRLVDNYPTRTIFLLSAVLFVSNIIIFLLEVTYRSFLPNNKENMYKTYIATWKHMSTSRHPGTYMNTWTHTWTYIDIHEHIHI